MVNGSSRRTTVSPGFDIKSIPKIDQKSIHGSLDLKCGFSKLRKNHNYFGNFFKNICLEKNF